MKQKLQHPPLTDLYMKTFCRYKHLDCGQALSFFCHDNLAFFFSCTGVGDSSLHLQGLSIMQPLGLDSAMKLYIPLRASIGVKSHGVHICKHLSVDAELS
jgi:hypothetical protein